MPPIKISPSSLDLLAVCPKFRYREYDNGKNLAAADGVKVHAALESGDDEDLTAEQVRSLDLTREFVNAQLISYLDWPNVSVDKRSEMHEQKLASEFGYRGKMDRFYISFQSERAFIADLKMGRLGLLADAADSYQLAAYAEIAWFTFKDRIKDIRVALSAPRTGEISVHDYKYEDLPAIKERIKKVIDDVEDPFCPPRFSDIACSKCALVDRCPVAKKDVLVPLSTTALAISPELLLKPVDQLTVQEIAENRAAMDLLEKWAEARKPLLDARVFSEGIDLPGYSKVTKAGAPFIPAEMTMRAFELLKTDLTPEEFISTCGRPKIGSIIELLANGQPGESLADRMEAAKIHMFDQLEELVAQSKSSQYLRRKSKLSSKLLTQ